MKTKKVKANELTGQMFDTLSPAAKERIYDDIDRMAAKGHRGRAPNRAERARLDRVAAKMGRGRPKLGRGTRSISVTVEAGLLARADAYAAAAGLKRSELITQGLRSILPDAGSAP